MIAPVEIGANVFTAAAIFLAGRNSVHTWWNGIVGCSLFALLFLASWIWWRKLARLSGRPQS